MKKFILLSLLFMSIQLSAQYSTPGNNGSYSLNDLVAISDGAISMSGSEYFFNEEIVISSTDTLKILEDISIEIGEGLLWSIEGVLIIDAPNVVFIKKKPLESNFEGIRFDNSSESLLKKVSISNGGGIKLVESDLEIINCSISDFDKAYSTGAVDLFQSNPLIRDCSFTNNEGPAIASGANSASSPQIINNVINYNVAGNENTPQVNLGTSDGLLPIIIDSNHVNGMHDNAGGIALSTLAGGIISAYIRNNEISGNRYGIAMIGSNISGEISHNFIEGNNIQNNPMLGGSGINFYGGNTNNLIVHHNIIMDNLWGITIQLEAQPNLGDGTDNSPGHNQIYNNGNSGEVYALYNNTSGNIMAKDNFWSTSNIEETEDVIYHMNDDLSLGEVFYDPVWFPVGMEEINEERFMVYPNPATDYVIWNGQETHLMIFDVKGKRIWEGQVQHMDKIDMSWGAGVYFVQFSDQNEKLIVK